MFQPIWLIGYVCMLCFLAQFAYEKQQAKPDYSFPYLILAI